MTRNLRRHGGDRPAEACHAVQGPTKPEKKHEKGKGTFLLARTGAPDHYGTTAELLYLIGVITQSNKSLCITVLLFFNFAHNSFFFHSTISASFLR